MAERRLFSKKITESDAFLDMPTSTQALYFHLNMNADDDGFVNAPNKIVRIVGASNDDLKLLIAKSFVIPFESGVVVIKHWLMHNLIRKDRYKETEYIDEKSQLYLKENGAYTLDETQGTPLSATKWQPNGNQVATQDKISKVKLSKDNINNSICDDVHIATPTNEYACEFILKNGTMCSRTSRLEINGKHLCGQHARIELQGLEEIEGKAIKKFVKPTIPEIRAYCLQNNIRVDAERFFNYYESKGWVVGKAPMKNWHCALANWAKENRDNGFERQYTESEMNSVFTDLNNYDDIEL